MKYWEFHVFRRIIRMMRIGYSPVVIMTGKPNTGKTMLGGLLAEVIHYAFYGFRRPWKPEKNCFFDMNTLSSRLLNAKKQAILIAEAGYDLSFDEWQSKCNKFFDKIVTTQRIMGNCYILNIPVAKDLARRHRRKVDFLFDIKFWGCAKVWQMRIKTREMAGNEFKSQYLGGLEGYPLPRCYERLKELDEGNKNNIRLELIKGFQEDQMKTIEIERMRKTIYKHHCSDGETYEWMPKKKQPRSCPGCKGRLYLDKGELQDVEVLEGK